MCCVLTPCVTIQGSAEAQRKEPLIILAKFQEIVTDVGALEQKLKRRAGVEFPLWLSGLRL